jgi:hypothetical protein
VLPSAISAGIAAVVSADAEVTQSRWIVRLPGPPLRPPTLLVA